jgi:hypothetical protein
MLRRDGVPAAILSAFLLASVGAFALGGLSDTVMDVMIGTGVLLFCAISPSQDVGRAPH